MLTQRKEGKSGGQSEGVPAGEATGGSWQFSFKHKGCVIVYSPLK